MVCLNLSLELRRNNDEARCRFITLGAVFVSRGRDKESAIPSDTEKHRRPRARAPRQTIDSP
jgi:hypothetical protein